MSGHQFQTLPTLSVLMNVQQKTLIGDVCQSAFFLSSVFAFALRDHSKMKMSRKVFPSCRILKYTFSLLHDSSLCNFSAFNNLNTPVPLESLTDWLINWFNDWFSRYSLPLSRYTRAIWVQLSRVFVFAIQSYQFAQFCSLFTESTWLLSWNTSEHT